MFNPKNRKKMKKIFTLFALMLAVLSVQAKTDKYYSTGLTNNASNATITNTWTLGWTGSTNNSARAFSGILSSISNYKKLHINVASGYESTSYRVILYCNNRTSTNAYAGTYTGSTTITLADLTYTSEAYDNHGYDDINIICVAGSGDSGSITFTEIYLESDEYEAMTITTTLNSSSTKTTPFAWYKGNSSTAFDGNLTNNLGSGSSSSAVFFGYNNNNSLANGYFDLAGYDKVKVTLSEYSSTVSTQMRLIAAEGTQNTINFVDGTTTYEQALTVTKCATIRAAQGTSSCQNVTSVDFIKDFKASSTTAFSIAASTSSTVAYDRTFTAGQKYTICLPFSLTKDEMDKMGAFYYFNSETNGVLDFKQASNSVSAYTPYIFVPSTTGTPFANLTNKTIAAPTATTVTKGNFTFTGLLAATTDIAAANSGKTVYGFNSEDGSFKKAGTGVSVNAFRAVIVGPTSAARSLNVNFSDSEITGITEVKSNGNGEAAIYNLAGQRVTANHKGLVINNGKKYIIK